MNSFFGMKIVMQLWGVFLGWQMLSEFTHGEVWWGIFYLILLGVHVWAVCNRREAPEDAE